jgi:hypothetical protein
MRHRLRRRVSGPGSRRSASPGSLHLLDEPTARRRAHPLSGTKRPQSDITVVSDDNNVGNNCRAHGAVVRPSSFIMEAKAQRPRRGGKAAAEGKGLDRKAAAAIDEELKKKFGI